LIPFFVFFQAPSRGYFRVFLPSFMSDGNKRRQRSNSASVRSQKKPKTSGSQPSKNVNGPGKPKQVGNVKAYARTFVASAEGATTRSKLLDLFVEAASLSRFCERLGSGWFVL
jgi:hypothetical protein